MSAMLQPGWRFRPMTGDDVERVMAVEISLYPYPWTAQIFSDCIRVGYRCTVVELDGEIVAYGVMSAGAGECHILNIAVCKDMQGYGLGRELLLYLLDQGRRHGADTAFLEVRPSNAVAIRLYKSIGFAEVGRRRHYYPAPDGREDALVLALHLFR